MSFVASYRSVIPIALAAAGLGFILGVMFSRADMFHTLTGVHSLIQKTLTYNTEDNTPRTTKAKERIAIPVKRRKVNGIQSISSMPNISGKVLFHDFRSWKIKNAICDEKKLANRGFLRANLRKPHRIPIYVYSGDKDEHVSGSIIRDGTWEEGWVNKLHSILRKDPYSVFIDIGANVGVYSLTMAKLGRAVIAVDAVEGNIARICKSVQAGNLKNNIVLIHNALSNRREKLIPGETFKNVGATFMRKIPKKISGQRTVAAVRLDDLLSVFNLTKVVMKMDVEGFENHILAGGRKFFQTVDVEYLMMEFAFHRNRSTGTFIINFLKEYGLKPQLNARMIGDYTKWPWDVLFKKDGI